MTIMVALLWHGPGGAPGECMRLLLGGYGEVMVKGGHDQAAAAVLGECEVTVTTVERGTLLLLPPFLQPKTETI